MTKKLTAQLKANQHRGIAAAIRITTTFAPEATLDEMIAAGKELGMNAATIKTQFYQARREDALIDRAQARDELKRTEIVETIPSGFTTIVVARHYGIRYIASFMTHSGLPMSLRREKTEVVGHYRGASLKIERNLYIAKAIWKAVKKGAKS